MNRLSARDRERVRNRVGYALMQVPPEIRPLMRFTQIRRAITSIRLVDAEAREAVEGKPS